MCRKLIARGASVDYVNRNGHTAIGLMVEHNLHEPINFLFEMGADPHIMDLGGEDACDKAKKGGIALIIPQFNNCNATLKKPCPRD